MKNKPWVFKFRENYGHKTYGFDFKKFMKNKNLTVEQLAKAIGYSVPGILVMLNRGTIKYSTLEKIADTKLGLNLNKYLGKKTTRKKRRK